VSADFVLFVCVGFLAQLVDGALGMAYGVVSASVLLSFGVSPAMASASVHAAEMFTSGASAGSHILNRNVNWPLFRALAPAGIAGGVCGAYVLTSIDGTVMRPIVTVYLGLMGLYILYRGLARLRASVPHRPAVVAAIGGAGGFMDAAGGGGWGPVVTSGLIGTGGAPREVIGTVNTTEFLVTVSVSVAFIWAILTGHWRDAAGFETHLTAVLGLIVGGVVAAPLAGFIVRLMPVRPLMLAVGGLISALALYQTWQLVG